jgi:large subunit ribosomal protein L17
MHRHGYQGRKLSLPRDQRRALLRGLVTSLVLHESITTTLASAKEAAPYFERLVTQARKNSLHGNRQIRTFLLTENSVQKFIQELVPSFEGRDGGYTRVVKAGTRRGDNAEMAVLALVLPEKKQAAKKADEATQSEVPEVKEKPAAKKPAAKKTAKA